MTTKTDNYRGTMTSENLAGKISARILPAYFKARKEDGRGAPTRIAFSQELFTEAVKLMENRQCNTKFGPGQKKIPKDEMMGMKVIYDESLAEGEWELRWVEMNTEEAKRVIKEDILPMYEHLVEAGTPPVALVVSFGLLTEIHRLQVLLPMENKEVDFDISPFSTFWKPEYGEVRLAWSGSSEDCTWALV